MNDKENIIDANFEEVTTKAKTKDTDSIEISYYTTRQVSEIIEEPDTTVRYWSNYFKTHLQLIYSNKNRAFTKQDVERLLQIKKLKEKGMTLKQIDDYFMSNGFESEKEIVDSKNPLAMETAMALLTSEMDKKMENFQDKLSKQVMAHMIAMEKVILANHDKATQEFKEQIALTIDEAVTDKMSEFTDDLKGVVDQLGDNVSEKVENSLKNASVSSEDLDKVIESNKALESKIEQMSNEIANKNKEAEDRDAIVVDKIKAMLDEKEKIRIKQEEAKKVEESNKGFFSRMFGK